MTTPCGLRAAGADRALPDGASEAGAGVDSQVRRSFGFLSTSGFMDVANA